MGSWASCKIGIGCGFWICNFTASCQNQLPMRKLWREIFNKMSVAPLWDVGNSQTKSVLLIRSPKTTEEKKWFEGDLRESSGVCREAGKALGIWKFQAVHKKRRNEQIKTNIFENKFDKNWSLLAKKILLSYPVPSQNVLMLCCVVWLCQWLWMHLWRLAIVRLNHSWCWTISPQKTCLLTSTCLS